jgi:hypothetical protein
MLQDETFAETKQSLSNMCNFNEVLVRDVTPLIQLKGCHWA